MSILEIVRAGAGSGKTTDLCQTVAAAVREGLDPSRILATTFTRKAAAELKGRIQAQILKDAAKDPALARRRAERLELAAIGTVHAVAHQILGRYSIQLGLSPRLDVLSEAGAKRALGGLLRTLPVDSWRELNLSARPLDVTDLRDRILKLLATKRGNRISDDRFKADMASSAKRLCELLAPGGPSPTARPVSLLLELAAQCLSKIDELPTDTTGDTEKAREKLRKLVSQEKPPWRVYPETAKLKAGKRSGAHTMLDPLKAEAGRVRENPALHADIKRFSELLADETIRLAESYKAYKAERGLLDFTDLEVLLLELLESEALSESLNQDFDLILVDEFQDTNPLQLALFQGLRRIAPRSRWVGDAKQAIYGFRDTDPELINEVWANAKNAKRTDLPKNYRSQKGLVQLVGRLFSSTFGDTAVQKPVRQPIPQGVERWLLGTTNATGDALALACGIAKLRGEGVRLGNIAVLERTNFKLEELAVALDALGIPYLIESPGLLSTREGVLLTAGLRLVADQGDSLAAATIVHLLSDPDAETPEWLIERLAALRAVEEAAERGEANASPRPLPSDGDARLAAVRRIDRRTLSPMLVVQQLIEALDLPTAVQNWADPARRCSNLDSLLVHAGKYEETARETGEAGTVTGLILYFEELIRDASDTRHPPLGHDAVTLITYHGAKGLEWPVVILSGLDYEHEADLWSPVATGGNSGDGDPLEGRGIRAWPWPFGYTGGPFPERTKGSGLGTEALSSDEGKERTVRSSQESLRLLYVGCTRARDKLIFVHRPGRHAWLKQLPAVDTLLNPARAEGEYVIDEVDTTLVIRSLRADMVEDCRRPATTTERWIDAAVAAKSPGQPQPRFHQPSQMPAPAAVGNFELQELKGPAHFPSGAKPEDYKDIGNAVHAYLAALPSLRASNESGREAVAERCLSSFSVTGLLTASALVSSGERFHDWVEAKFSGARWFTEVPVTVSRSAGGHWNGAVDLVLQLPDGEIVIIDHKSAPLRREQCAAKAATFGPQLDAYREMLECSGSTVASCWIHFPLAGVVARQD